MSKPREHCKQTEALARLLKPADLYDWLTAKGYYPERYVLPPCFYVGKHPKYGKRFFPFTKKRFTPPFTEPCELCFPKTQLTDRPFAVIDPQVHSDIALEISSEWNCILDLLFNLDKQVFSYSFPVPLSSRTPGKIGGLRAGRMIYEWIEMAENDLVEEAYAYRYLLKTDVKNFYPSVYTHSIAWALHSKPVIRASKNRWNYTLLGNRLDKLSQSANDGCTNGLPIGPVVSDLLAEIILSAIDLAVSPELKRMDICALRFKDDYRFLCKTEEDCKKVIKVVQRELKEYNLLLNEEKTDIAELPEGIFRQWVSKYDAIRPREKQKLKFREFREFYLAVLRIDAEVPGTGIIDKFIADITLGKASSYSPLFPISTRHIDKTVSLLLLLADRRMRSFPRVLGLLESMIALGKRTKITSIVEAHLNKLLKNLIKDPEDNLYRISWILYFLKSNKLGVRRTLKHDNPILRSIQSNKGYLFSATGDFKLFRGVRASRKSGSLLELLDVFNPQ